MKSTVKTLFLLCLSCAVPPCLKSQTTADIDSIFTNKTEVIFKFVEPDKDKVNQLSEIISIDRLHNDTVTAYANKEEFTAFAALSYPYHIYSKPEQKYVNMATTLADMFDWDKYPTYDVYLELMQYYADNYPNICKLDTIGTSVKGRLILSMQLSTRLNADTTLPKFFYSSTMHGDEVTGYYFMLRLIDTLVNGVENDVQIQNILSSSIVYINPLSNPDGTYYSGDTNVSRSIRYNANRKDLNRNYPDPFSNTSSASLQPENKAMIEYAGKHHFTMAANLHGGAEVLNFPWDSYRSSTKRHADHNWWVEVCKRFVNTCRQVDSETYSTDFTKGYTAGGDWYVIRNGRQDYMNHTLRVREMTIEVSLEKTLPSNMLQQYWNTQCNALINYIEEMQRCIRGIVVDKDTKQRIEGAIVAIANHDRENSEVTTNGTGHFFRPIDEGEYTLTISAEGYVTKQTDAITVAYPNTETIVVEMEKSPTPTDTTTAMLFPNPCTDYVEIASHKAIDSYIIVSASGNTVANATTTAGKTLRINITHLSEGVYFLKMYSGGRQIANTFTFIKQ